MITWVIKSQGPDDVEGDQRPKTPPLTTTTTHYLPTTPTPPNPNSLFCQISFLSVQFRWNPEREAIGSKKKNTSFLIKFLKVSLFISPWLSAKLILILIWWCSLTKLQKANQYFIVVIFYIIKIRGKGKKEEKGEGWSCNGGGPEMDGIFEERERKQQQKKVTPQSTDRKKKSSKSKLYITFHPFSYFSI